MRPLRAQTGLPEPTLLCAPAWRHWRWSLKLSSAAPTGVRLSQAADLAAALKEQTEALKEALSARGGSNSITTVKTDLVWPTLTDDKSDTKDVTSCSMKSSKTSVPWRTTAAACLRGRSFWPCGPVVKGRGPRLTQTLTGRRGRPARSWTTPKRSISASRINT